MKNKFSRSKHSQKSSPSPSRLSMLRSASLGAGIGLICLSLLLFVCALICIYAGDPHRLLTPLAFFCIYASAFASGLVGARKNHFSSLLLCGALSGLIYVLALSLILMLPPFCSADSADLKSTMLLRALTLPCSLLGAVCSPKRTSAKRHKHR